VGKNFQSDLGIFEIIYPAEKLHFKKQLHITEGEDYLRDCNSVTCQHKKMLLVEFSL